MTYTYKCGTTDTEQNDTPMFMQLDTSDQRRMMFKKGLKQARVESTTWITT